MRKLRRNDVVYERDDKVSFVFYARVWRLIDNETVQIINAKGEVGTFLMEDLVYVGDYRGYWDKRKFDPNLPDPHYPDNLGYWHQFVWRPMPTLRRLKQRARWWRSGDYFEWRYRQRK